MYIQKRKDRKGQFYYSILYRDKDGKIHRVPQKEHPTFRTEEDARTWAKSREAIRAAEKDKHARKIAWRDQYHNFTELLEKYRLWQTGRAPNSWEASLFYLEQWALPFFLQEKQLGNANNWHLFFREFVDWMESPGKSEVRGNKKLAVSTMNNIIKALNGFLICLGEYNLIDPDSIRKCKAFPAHKVRRRTFEDVISQSEMEVVRTRMAVHNKDAADFFFVLWHTGMRFSELFGLPITALFKGEVENKSIKEELQKHNISTLGYIYLESQPRHDDKRRNDDKIIERKPLKSCREISARYSRVIPIRSKEVWNILATRYKAQLELVVQKKFGTDKHNYVFFEDLEWNVAVNTLRQSYKDLKQPPKSYHSCRHSFVTHLVGETKSFFLVRAITGHRKDASFDRYLHIYEQIAREAKQQSQDIDLIS